MIALPNAPSPLAAASRPIANTPCPSFYAGRTARLSPTKAAKRAKPHRRIFPPFLISKTEKRYGR
ncbi:hypothetical protein GCWU000324_01225 [Kingella oralis ATCC 51147]|uniref:Uncharacterized protein n=1 Tax=Kingella oralis ATCC 51147 TaxID=629741 RepID=C4GGF7_9NEIS|nr:hypothetical protein GCWU000324_01225 [Kingella oralis ATCC 51147]